MVNVSSPDLWLLHQLDTAKTLTTSFLAVRVLQIRRFLNCSRYFYIELTYIFIRVPNYYIIHIQKYGLRISNANTTTIRQ